MEESVETSKELERSIGVEIDDRGKGETEKEVVSRTPGEFRRVREVGKPLQLGLVEKERVEPVDSALMPVRGASAI